MSWGYKIIIFYSAFVVGILFLVIKSVNEKTDLVTTDYYAQELKHQQQIDAVNRSFLLSAPVTVQLNNENLLIIFPPDFIKEKITGSILLYYPADKNNDIEKSFSTDSLKTVLPLPTGKRGYYEVKLKYKVKELDYFFEKKIFI